MAVRVGGVPRPLHHACRIHRLVGHQPAFALQEGEVAVVGGAEHVALRHPRARILRQALECDLGGGADHVALHVGEALGEGAADRLGRLGLKLAGVPGDLSLALYLLARRADRLSETEAPKSWRELTDPKWRDKLAIGHPGFSGAIGNWAIMMRKAYGEGYFRELERNKPQIGRSAGDPVTTLNAGERLVGVAVPSAATLFSASRGNPLSLIYPTDGTLMVPSPSAAIANAPRPNAAKLFMEFMTSPAYSAATRPFFAESLRPEVPPPEGSRPLDEITLISPTPEQVETEMTEVKELWRDIFGV